MVVTLADWQDERRTNPDGTVDSVQRAPASRTLGPHELDRLYWTEMRAQMLGLVGFRRGAVRALGVVPLLRLGPLQVEGTYGRRAILGGLLARRSGGSIGFGIGDGVGEIAVRSFRPLLPRPVYTMQEALHLALSRRVLTRLQVDGRG